MGRNTQSNTIKQVQSPLFDSNIINDLFFFQVEDNNTVKQGRNTLFDGVIVLKCLVF